MMYRKIVFILLVILLSTPSFSEESYDPTNDLLFAFGSRCKGKGSLNSTAMNDSQSLKNIAEGLRDDKSCQGIYGAINDIQKLNIPQLLKEKNSQLDLDFLATQASDLELALQNEQKNAQPDNDYVAALKSELITTKTNIAKYQKTSQRERLQRRLETIENFYNYSNNLFAKLKQNDQCLMKNPNLSAQLSSQLLGMASTLPSGLLGSLVLTSGQLIDNFISYFREKGINSKIKYLNTHRLGEALGCTFEGLAHTYCTARDAESVIAFNKNKLPIPQEQNWLNGIGISGQDAESFTAWAYRLDSGSPAGSSGRASDKKQAIALKSSLDAISADLDGILNSAKRTIQQSSDKVAATQKSLNDLAAKIAPPQYESAPTVSPFVSLFSADPNCGPYVYLYSKGKDRSKSDAMVNCTNYVADKYTDLPNFENGEIENILNNLKNQARSNVMIQSSMVNEANPDFVIATADAKLANKRTPREFLTASEAYLQNLLSDPQSIAKFKNQNTLITKTLSTIQKSLTLLDKQDEAQNKVNELTNLLVPSGSADFLPKSIYEIINQDIDYRIQQGSIDENIAVLTQQTASDSLAVLISQLINLEPARTQTRSAKSLSKANLTTMGSLFSTNLENRFKQLHEESKNDSDAQENLALLCMQTLAIPEAPDMSDFNSDKFCKDRKYDSVYPDSKISMNYNDLKAKPFQDRVCAVYDFYRKSYFYGLKKSNERNTKINRTTK